MQTKLEAARIATGAGIPVVLTDMAHARRRWPATTIGTLFHPTGRRRPTRLLWLAHATEAKGRIVLDAGAVRAVDRAPRLAAAGRHHRGRRAGSWPATPSTSSTRRAGGRPRAGELRRGGAPGLLGRSTRELARELGAAYEREVVHRDDLVVL